MKTGKTLEIKLNDPYLDKDERPALYKDEFPHLYFIREISREELDRAFNIIITRMMQNNETRYVIDLDAREKGFTPPKEMTLEEIEEALGCRIKIVKEK